MRSNLSLGLCDVWTMRCACVAHGHWQTSLRLRVHGAGLKWQAACADSLPWVAQWKLPTCIRNPVQVTLYGDHIVHPIAGLQDAAPGTTFLCTS